MSSKERFYEKLQQIREDYDPNERDKASWSKKLANSAKSNSSGKFKKANRLTANLMDKQSEKHEKKAVTGLDEEQLDEVSASKLGRYLAKASKQKKNIQDRMNAGIDGTGEGISRRTFRTGMRRVRGTENAIKKLTGTAKVPASIKEEQLQELTKSKLKSYVKRARDEGNVFRDPSSTSLGALSTKNGKKYEKRLDYVEKAEKRLKEEQQLDELSSAKARAAENKAVAKFYDKYDSTTDLRKKAIKSKKKEDIDAANDEQQKMHKHGRQAAKFQKYADKKMNESDDKKESSETKKLKPLSKQATEFWTKIYNKKKERDAKKQLDELTGYRKPRLFGKDPLAAVSKRAVDRMKVKPKNEKEKAQNAKSSKVMRWVADRVED